MDKKRLLVLLLVLVCIQTVSGVKEEIFNGKLNPSDSVELDGINLTAQSYGIPPTKVVVKYGDTTSIVDLEQCFSQVKMTICFLGYEDGDHDYESQKLSYKVEITVEQDVSDLDIVRKLVDRDIEIGDESDITVSIKNPSDATVKDIEYSDSFPAEIEIVSNDGKCTRGVAGITWKGELKSGAEHKCKYRIKIKNPVELKSRATLKFNNGIVKKEKETGAITFEIKNEFFDIVTGGGEDVTLQENFMYFLNITNTQKKQLEIKKLEVRLPTNVEVVRRDVAWRDLIWSGPISSNKTRSLWLELKGVTSGTGDVVASIDFVFNGIDLNIENTKPLEIKKPELVLISNFSTYQYGAGSKVPVKFNLSNPTAFGFKNLNIDISANYKEFEPVSFRDLEISNNASISILDRKVDWPDVSSTFDVEITVTWNYDTYTGEHLTGEYTEYLFAIPDLEGQQEKAKAEVEKVEESEQVVTSTAGSAKKEEKKVEIERLGEKPVEVSESPSELSGHILIIIVVLAILLAGIMGFSFLKLRRME